MISTVQIDYKNTVKIVMKKLKVVKKTEKKPPPIKFG